MSHKGQITTLEERVTIAERVNAGQSSREIAEELGRPLPTIRKWRQRYLRKGRAGLTSRMGRPAAGALATAPAEMKDAILELREKHPGWGAQTLRLEIAKDERFFDLSIPSRSRIAAYLKEQNKVRKYERHQDLPEPKARPAQRPHQEWVHGALDTVGFIPGLGEIADGLNGLIYLGEGRYLEASISALAMIPLAGDLAKGGKWTFKLGKGGLDKRGLITPLITFRRKKA